MTAPYVHTGKQVLRSGSHVCDASDPETAAMIVEALNWPCGHPKTEVNTQSVGKAGVRCRLCRRAIARKYQRLERGAPVDTPVKPYRLKNDLTDHAPAPPVTA